MSPDLYLERIGFAPSVALRPDVETLARLHEAHLRAVPFENLDIHGGRRIELELPALFDKVVTRRRGGFCYELNGLFAWLLETLGFELIRLSGRVYSDESGLGPEFDHLALAVELDERRLADVGFGDSFLRPLRLDTDDAQADGGSEFRFVDDGARRVLERREPGAAWQRQYTLSAEPRALSDFEPMCDYHQTSPSSHFTRKRVCSLATSGGRITLSGRTLIETEAGVRRERELADETECQRVLAERFGVVLESR